MLGVSLDVFLKDSCEVAQQVRGAEVQHDLRSLKTRSNARPRLHTRATCAICCAQIACCSPLYPRRRSRPRARALRCGGRSRRPDTLPWAASVDTMAACMS